MCYFVIDFVHLSQNYYCFLQELHNSGLSYLIEAVIRIFDDRFAWNRFFPSVRYLLILVSLNRVIDYPWSPAIDNYPIEYFS